MTVLVISLGSGWQRESASPRLVSIRESGFVSGSLTMNLSYSTSPTSSTGSYFSEGTSRPSSTSPTFSQSSLSHMYKVRLDAGRGFDAEDDLVFCPALAPAEPAPHSYIAAGAAASVVRSPEYAPVDLRSSALQTPIVAPARARRALEIIDPATGLRVESPKPVGR